MRNACCTHCVLSKNITRISEKNFFICSKFLIQKWKIEESFLSIDSQWRVKHISHCLISRIKHINNWKQKFLNASINFPDISYFLLFPKHSEHLFLSSSKIELNTLEKIFKNLISIDFLFHYFFHLDWTTHNNFFTSQREYECVGEWMKCWCCYYVR